MRKASKIDNYFQIVTYALFAGFLKYVFRIAVTGRENINIKGPAVFISNHGAKLDPFLIVSAMGWKNFLKFYPWRFPLAKQYADHYIIGGPAWFVGCYKIEGKGDLKKSLENTYRNIEKGFSLIFFPQGKVTMMDEEAEPKKGIGQMCLDKDISIVPVKISYNGGKGKKNAGRVYGSKVSFGIPFESADLRKQWEREKIHLAAMSAVNEI